MNYVLRTRTGFVDYFVTHAYPVRYDCKVRHAMRFQNWLAADRCKKQIEKQPALQGKTTQIEVMWLPETTR